MHSKKWLAAALLAFFTLQSVDVFARVGSGRSGSSMRSSSAQAAPYRAPEAASSRVGNGDNAGMQRPDVMNQARTNDAAGSATASPGLNQGQSAAQAKPGYGVGSLVGAAAAGAAIGYIANSAMHSGEGQPAAHDSGSSGSFGEQSMPTNNSRNGNGSLTFIMLALLAGLGFWLYRRTKALSDTASSSTNRPLAYAAPASAQSQSANAASLNDEQTEIEQAALAFFNDLQAANNRGDIAFIRANVTPDLRQVLLDDIQKRQTPSQTQVVNMTNRLIDLSDNGQEQIASVRFSGLVRESPAAVPEDLDEVWHFVRNGDTQKQWQLAGIEQI